MIPMEQLQILTGEHLLVTLFILLLTLAIFVLVANAIIAFRKLRKPKTQQEFDLSEHQRDCETRFDNDYKAIQALSARVAQLEKGQRVTCAAQRALLEHALHNGNADEMKRASDNLFQYLNEKE